MNIITTQELQNLIGVRDFEEYKNCVASEIEDIVRVKLSKFGLVERQYGVPDRGDGYRGRVDLVFHYKGQLVPIEIDRGKIRAKSIFKTRSVNPDNAFVITRKPYKITKV